MPVRLEQGEKEKVQEAKRDNKGKMKCRIPVAVFHNSIFPPPHIFDSFFAANHPTIDPACYEATASMATTAAAREAMQRTWFQVSHSRT